MVRILHRGILNAKLINHKAKDGVSVFMDPNARFVLYMMIPKWIYMFHRLLVSNNTGLFKSTHALLHLWLSTIVVRLYVSMISYGMTFNGMRMNSGSGKIFFK